MEKINLINTFAKMTLITFFIYLTYQKIINKKSKNISYIIILFFCIMISLIYSVISRYIHPIIVIIIIYMIYGMIICIIQKNKFNYVGYIYSCIITYVIYLITILIAGILLSLFLKNSEYANPISLITILSIYVILYSWSYRRKRFSNGFNFLKSKTNISVNIFILFLSGTLIIIFGISHKSNYWLIGIYLIFCSILIVISLTIWIKSQITKTYKNKMRDRTIEMQKAEIDEKEKIIEEIKAENLKFANTIHKYNHKFESLEFAMKNALKLDSKEEFANEIAVILEESKNTAKNFAKETKVDTRKIPLTNINGIDTMFKYMQEKAIKNNIQFDLKINASINSLINEIIPKEKFETLIGDHIKDAIIAINSNNKTYKSILVTLGLVDGIYEFSVYDTGVEFKIDTLIKLGIEQVTTHKEEGGSGIGFMTTFKTLKECKASLVIEEYNPETTNYTKAITIRFDGKDEYKIYSYRAEKIKEQKGKRRIIIKRIK